MTVRLPWFAFYVDRFTKETSLLNPIEVAVYYRFLESYAQNGYLPDDVYLLQEIVRLDSALTIFRALTDGAKPDRNAWEAIKEATINKLLHQFFTLGSDGNYSHEGWNKELNKSEKKYSNGLKRAALMNEKRGRGAAPEDAAIAESGEPAAGVGRGAEQC